MFKIDRRNVKICEPDRINSVPAPKEAGAGSVAPSGASAAPAGGRKEPISVTPSVEEILAAARTQAKGIVSRAEAEAEAAAASAAEEILAEARAKAQAEAEEIIRAAEAEAVGIGESARKAGYDEGIQGAQEENQRLRDELEAKALQQREELAAEAIRRKEELESETLRQRKELASDLKALCDGLSAGQEEMYAALEENAVALALGIARKIIGAAIEWESEAYNSLIKNALKHMKREGKLHIRLCEKDFSRLFPDGSATFTLGDTVVTAAVEVNPGMQEGDCIIDSDAERVDAGVESQLKLVEIAFRNTGEEQ